MRDLEHQTKEDTKAIERQLDQISALSARNKTLKMKCTETVSIRY